MRISLNPELARFIEEQVEAGRFTSAAAVLEAGVARLMLDPPPEELDAEDAGAAEEGFAQARRGKVQPWARVREEFRARYFGK